MFTRRHLLKSLAALSAAAPAYMQDTPVHLRAGKLQGYLDKGIRVFKGVPFAQPPVGSLRFRVPVPPKPWNEVRQATEYAPSPIQSAHQDLNSEDCLYLNIFAPAAPGLHPVLVWIYGGGNIAGSTNSPIFDGSAFARDGIVCVTIAYRVGALGFLELGHLLGPDYEGSGNNGIRDQVMALHWVRDNISDFGGDPSRVTVGGQSAGAKDVAALFAAPAAQGLFRSAVMESGSGQTVFTRLEAQNLARLFAGARAPELKTMSVGELLASQDRISKDFNIGFPFRPFVDGTFLPKTPLELVAAGASRKLPLLLGTNREESASFVHQEQASQALVQKELANTEIAKLAPVEAGYEKAFPNSSIAQRHIRMLTAEEYWVPSVRFADAHSSGGGPTFMYRFDGPSGGGAVHASEVPFVWNQLASSTSNPLAQQMHDSWVSFIRNGAPAASSLPKWPPYSVESRQTMIFSGTSLTQSNPNKEELALWQNVL